MARIIGQIESLKSLRTELNKRNIDRFNSIAEISNFENNFIDEKRRILNTHENNVSKEIKQLSEEIEVNKAELESRRSDAVANINKTLANNSKKLETFEAIETSFIRRIIRFVRIEFLKRKISYLQTNYDHIIDGYIKSLKQKIAADSEKLNYLSGNKEKVIAERGKNEIEKLDYIKNVIDELKPLILGAIGENLVEKEIKKLPDDYILINDFSLKFNPPIYNKKSKDRIFSIQIDHLLISKSGIYILETKNWSKKSIESLDLRSPVDQINRTSYALFVVANNIKLKNHHWGKKLIPIRSIIVMVNEKPKDEFKFVKVKRLKELNSYIEFFDPVFTDQEVEKIADYLMSI